MPAAAAARGRKPVPANRSRQQLQRERALQVAAQRNAGAASLCLPPEQQLAKPPPPPPPAKDDSEPQPTAPPAAADRHTPTDVRPAPAEESAGVKELEIPEVALLVYLFFYFCDFIVCNACLLCVVTTVVKGCDLCRVFIRALLFLSVIAPLRCSAFDPFGNVGSVNMRFGFMLLPVQTIKIKSSSLSRDQRR